jgi:predicted nucleic acid-binding protein
MSAPESSRCSRRGFQPGSDPLGVRKQLLDVIDSDDLVLSVQATRASKPTHITHEQAVNLIESWLRFQVQDNTVAVLQAALSTRLRWGISYWDAAIVEAARAAMCVTLLTEDLQDGMDFAGLRVVNPFR